jgi:hypothetical protein
VSGVPFFVPRTAWGGPAPRLALPYLDPSLPGPWAGAFVAGGDDFRRLMEDLEPLLVSLYVAGYVVPEIAVLTEGAAPKLGVTTGRVDLSDPATWTPPPPPAPADVVAVLLLVRPLRLASPPTTSWSPLAVPSLGVAPGQADVWVSIALEATDHATLRAALQNRVLDESGAIKAQVGGLGTTPDVGLAHLYDVDRWASVTGRDLLDHERAARDLAAALALNPGDALGHELGQPARQPTRPTIYQYRSLTELVRDLGAAWGDVAKEADTRALLTKLRAGLAALQRTPEYGDVSLTTALLDLDTRGLVDILGPPAEDDLSAVLEILALAPSVRLDAGQIGVLCAHLSRGPGQATDEAAARLALEYRHLDVLGRDAALAGQIVQAFVDISIQAEAVPDQPAPVGRSFELYVDTLRGMMAAVAAAAPDPAKVKAAAQAIWTHWSGLIDDAAVGPKVVYAAVRLFVLGTDIELAAALTMTAVDRYSLGLAKLAKHWRTDEGAAQMATVPELVGWGNTTFVSLCQSAWRLQTPGLESLLSSADRSRLGSTLRSMYGTAPFSPTSVEAVERRFGKLLSGELAKGEPGSARRQLADLLALIQQTTTEWDTARRCDLAAVAATLDEVLADPTCATLIPDTRAQAARDVLGATAVHDLALRHQQWILSDPTQAYLATLDPVSRSVEESQLLDALGRIAPELVQDTILGNAGARFGGEFDRFLRDVDEDEVAAQINKVVAANDVGLIAPSEAKNLAKIFKAGVKLGPTTTAVAGDWVYTTSLAVPAWLTSQDLMTSDEFHAVWSVANRVATRIDALPPDTFPISQLRYLGDVGAAAAALIAAGELLVKGWGEPFDGLGRWRDVVNGVIPTLDLLRGLTTWVFTGASALPLAKISTTVAVLADLFSTLSPFVSILTNGASAAKAASEHEWVEAGLYTAAVAANGVLFYVMSTAGASGVALGLGVPGLGFIAAGFTVAAVLWHYWNLRAEDLRNEAAYEQLVLEHGLLYADKVFLYPPSEVAIATALVGPDVTAVMEETPLAVVDVVGDTGPTMSGDFDDGAVGASLLLRTDEEGVTRAFSPVPGLVEWMVGTIEIPELPPESDPDDTPTVPSYTGGEFARVSPEFEHWLFGPSGATVRSADVPAGGWVSKGQRVAVLAAGTTTQTVTSDAEGRIVSVIAPGGAVGSDGVLAKIRPEGRDLLIEFSEASEP